MNEKEISKQNNHDSYWSADVNLCLKRLREVNLECILLPLRVIFKIYYLAIFVLSLIISYPIVYFLLSKPERFPMAFSLMRRHAFMLLVFAGARLKVRGIGNIPQNGSYIICPNHSSFLDIFCIYALFPKYFVFTGKKEIEKWPLFHIYYTSGMNILVDRNSKIGSVKALKKIMEEIDKDNPIVIFPEGTISKQAPILAPFKSGAFSIAIQKQVPILPVTFVTNWKLLQRSGIWKGKAGPGVAEVVIHKPIITKGLCKEQVDRLQTQVKNTINGPLFIRWK